MKVDSLDYGLRRQLSHLVSRASGGEISIYYEQGNSFNVFEPVELGTDCIRFASAPDGPTIVVPYDKIVYVKRGQ